MRINSALRACPLDWKKDGFFPRAVRFEVGRPQLRKTNICPRRASKEELINVQTDR